MHEKFAEQMHLIQHASETEVEELHDYPKTEQYLSFVGVDEDVIQVSIFVFYVLLCGLRPLLRSAVVA